MDAIRQALDNPALPSFYGTWAAGTLIALVQWLARRWTFSEAATAFFSSFFTAAGLGLVAFHIGHSPNGWLLAFGLLLAGGGLGSAWWMRRRIRRARAGAGPPVTGATPAGIFLAGAATLLVIAHGIGIVLAPVTLPAMWMMSRRNGPVLRVWLGAAATLTTLAGGIILGALAAPDHEWLRWLLGGAFGLATLVCFGWPRRRVEA